MAVNILKDLHPDDLLQLRKAVSVLTQLLDAGAGDWTYMTVLGKDGTKQYVIAAGAEIGETLIQWLQATEGKVTA